MCEAFQIDKTGLWGKAQTQGCRIVPKSWIGDCAKTGQSGVAALLAADQRLSLGERVATFVVYIRPGMACGGHSPHVIRCDQDHGQMPRAKDTSFGV